MQVIRIVHLAYEIWGFGGVWRLLLEVSSSITSLADHDPNIQIRNLFSASGMATQKQLAGEPGSDWMDFQKCCTESLHLLSNVTAMEIPLFQQEIHLQTAKFSMAMLDYRRIFTIYNGWFVPT